MKSRLSVFVLLCLLCTALTAGAQQSDPASGQRLALLIGNASYPDAPSPLALPTKNVRALAEELQRSGFEVDVKENLGKEEMQRALDAFKQKIKSGIRRTGLLQRLRPADGAADLPHPDQRAGVDRKRYPARRHQRRNRSWAISTPAAPR